MDKSVFADPEAQPQWWLLARDLDYTLVDLRKDLAEALGCDRESEWFLERWRLESLYDIVEVHDRALLIEVEDAADDYRRKEWLTRVLAVVNKAVSGQAAPAEGDAARSPNTPGTDIEGASEIAKEIIADLAPDKLGSTATVLGMSETQLKGVLKELPANFEELVAAEVARQAAAES